MMPGEIYWAVPPESGGREQSKRRPYVVLQDDTYARRSPLVLLAAMTTQSHTARFPSVVGPIVPDAVNGLTQPSYVLVFQTRALDRDRIFARIGTLDPATLAAVYEALDRLTGRPPAVTAPPADPA